jgi:transposase
LRTGSPWRDLPSCLGPWQSAYTRFRCWSDSGLWSYMLTELAQEGADLEYLMVDSSSVRVHQDAARTHRGQEVDAMGKSRGGLTTKVHALCDALGYPLAFILTCGQRGDATQGIGLLLKAMQPGCSCLLDGGYDSDAIREYVLQEGGTAVIPPKNTRTTTIPFDKHTYKERHKVENLFQKLKRFRRIATRYEKKVTRFAAMIAIAAILIWIRF